MTDRDRAPEPVKPTGIVGAMLALEDLRMAMRTVHVSAPGTSSTAHDNCGQVLDMIEFGLRQLAVYLNVHFDDEI